MKPYPLFRALVLICFPLLGWSQDYLPIQPGRTYFWTKNLATRIDSIQTDTSQNQTFWFTQASRFCDEVSNNVFRDSLATNNPILGMFWVSNGTLPTYPIPYTLQLNQESPFLQINDTSYIWRSEGLTKSTFLSTSDSIITLRIIVQNSLGQELSSHPLHQKAFIISKNHGALNWLGKLDKSSHSYPDLFSCIGISNPDLAEAGLSKKDVYDILPGDEVHHIKDRYIYFGYQASYWKWVCVGRDTVGNDQIRIIRENTKRSVDMDADNRKDTTWTNTLNYRDTLTIPLSDIPVFPMMVGNQPFPGGKNYSEYGNGYIPNVKGFHITSAQKNGNLWCEQIVLDLAFGINCFEGLGCYSYSASGFDPFGSRDKVIFFRKKHGSWGTPLPDSIFTNAVSISDEHPEPQVRVFPNPGQALIQVEIPRGLSQMDIYNSTGALIRSERIDIQPISVHDLPPGIYLLSFPEVQQQIKWVKQSP